MNTYMSRTVASLITLAACAITCFAQDSSKNAFGDSPPPEIRRFEPFLGRYSAVLVRPGRGGFQGSLELSYAIKGWYIEFNLLKESAGPHRHLRLMIAWDTNEKKYRVWRFETTAPLPVLEGVIKFEGDNEWYAEWRDFPQPGGKRVTYILGFRLKNKDELEIINEIVDAEGKKRSPDVTTAKRKM